MGEALKQAQYAFEEGEVPVGAVVVCENRIISRAYNQVERLQDVTAHAEMLAITAAQDFLGAKYLQKCSLYVTLEPCTMCLGAIKQARISTIVFGAHDAERGACGSIYDLSLDSRVGPVPKVITGVREAESVALLQGFFKAKR